MKRLGQRFGVRLAAALFFFLVTDLPASANEMQNSAGEVIPLADTASPISIGEIVAGEITDPGGAASYVFSALPGQRVYLDVISTSNVHGLIWSLTDAFGRVILQNTASLIDLGPVYLMGGEYRVTIRSETTGTGTFEFKVVASPVSSSSFSVGDAVQGTIATPGGRIDYTFAASAGDTIFINVVSTTNPGLLELQLTSPGGRVILPPTGSLWNGYGPFVLQGGAYNLTVLGEKDGVGEFEFEVLPVSITESAVSLGETVCGAITSAGSSNRHSFTVLPGQIVQVDVLTVTSFSGLNYLLEDGLGRAILPRMPNFSDSPPLPLVGGDYVLSVLGEGSVTGEYCFDLLDGGTSSFTPSGALIAVGDTVEDAIDVEGETDSYQFAVLEGERVFLDLTLGQFALRWTLLDPVGRPLFENARAQSPGNDQGPFRLTAGDYTLQIFATSGTPAYSFTLWPASEQFTAVTLGDRLEDSFAAPGDRHHYDISLLSDPDRVYLRTLQGSTQLRGSMSDEVGQAVLDNVSMTAGQQPMVLDLGTYRLSLNTTSGTQASYAVDLVNVIDEDGGAVNLGEETVDVIPGVRGSRSYSLTIDEGSQVVVFRMTAPSSVRWSVIDPVNHPVFSARSGLAPPYVIRLAAGTYEIEVFSTSLDTPAYSFNIAPDAIFAEGFETIDE